MSQHIYVITAIYNNKSSRAFGYFLNLKRAFDAINKNCGSMYESPFAAEKDHKKRPLVFSHNKSWHRYDNTLDYYIEMRNNDPTDHVNNLGKHSGYIFHHNVKICETYKDLSTN